MSLPETPTRVVLFLSTLSLRRATANEALQKVKEVISIHALLAESDHIRSTSPGHLNISIHALLAESDLVPHQQKCGDGFLSTLSLRRATNCPRVMVSPTLYFYPRSPCGERRAGYGHVAGGHQISIHALLAESDVPRRGI